MDWEHEAGHKCPAEIKAFFEDIKPCLAILHADAVTVFPLHSKCRYTETQEHSPI